MILSAFFGGLLTAFVVSDVAHDDVNPMTYIAAIVAVGNIVVAILYLLI